jgi:hypothetical protein
LIIWVPVEVDDSALARLVRRARHGQAESKRAMPAFKRIPSWFGYTVVPLDTS